LNLNISLKKKNFKEKYFKKSVFEIKKIYLNMLSHLISNL
jgi:hypothetical protein